MEPRHLTGQHEPSGSSGPPSQISRAKAEVKVPAIMLIAVAVLSMLVSLAAFASSDESMMETERSLHPDRVYLGGGSLIPSWANLFPLFFSGVIAWGAWRMRALRDYRLAVVVSVMAMVPCFMPCCFVSVPVSIWALVMLMKPEVKSAFS